MFLSLQHKSTFLENQQLEFKIDKQLTRICKFIIVAGYCSEFIH